MLVPAVEAEARQKWCAAAVAGAAAERTKKTCLLCLKGQGQAAAHLEKKGEEEGKRPTKGRLKLFKRERNESRETNKK